MSFSNISSLHIFRPDTLQSHGVEIRSTPSTIQRLFESRSVHRSPMCTGLPIWRGFYPTDCWIRLAVYQVEKTLAAFWNLFARLTHGTFAIAWPCLTCVFRSNVCLMAGGHFHLLYLSFFVDAMTATFFTIIFNPFLSNLKQTLNFVLHLTLTKSSNTWSVIKVILRHVCMHIET